VEIAKAGSAVPMTWWLTTPKGQLNQGLWGIGLAFYAFSQFEADLLSA